MPRGTIWRELQLRFSDIDVGTDGVDPTFLIHSTRTWGSATSATWTLPTLLCTVVLCQVSPGCPVGPAGYCTPTRWPGTPPPRAYINAPSPYTLPCAELSLPLPQPSSTLLLLSLSSCSTRFKLLVFWYSWGMRTVCFPGRSSATACRCRRHGHSSTPSGPT